MGSVHSSLVHPDLLLSGGGLSSPWSAKGRRRQKCGFLAPLGHPSARTDKGPVEGKRHYLEDGRWANVFLGIPFAKPPVGELRFKKPEEPDAWGPLPLAARRYGPRPIQKDFLWDRIELGGVPKSEDCLQLNVVAPGWERPAEMGDGWPVMVYIHGGGFIIDSAVKYNYANIARCLVRHGVLVVTVQYRLGLLGFLSTGDPVCPGNLGLWDQLAALRWVNRNIAAFGGDPSRVTLFGHSAGAVSADLLSVSPLARDLFQQTILMGGTAENIWAVSPGDQLAVHCRQWAVRMGFPAASSALPWDRAHSERMLAFLRGLPARKFEMTLLGDRTIIEQMRLAVSPVLDGELLPRPVAQLRAESPAKRVLCGLCHDEGLLFLALGLQRADNKFLGYCEQRMLELLAEARRRLDAQGEEKEEEKEEEENMKEEEDDGVPDRGEFRRLYGLDGEEERERENSKGKQKTKQRVQRTCVTMMSDLVNNIGAYNFCSRATALGWPLWRFRMDHFNADSTRALNPLLPFRGSTHGNELHYVFDINFFVTPWRRTAVDRAVLERTTSWLTNFAKFGDPNGPSSVGEEGQSAADNGLAVRWEPVDGDNPERQLSIEGTEWRMREGSEDSDRVRRLARGYAALLP